MATYAIGDVQGCADELRELLGAAAVCVLGNHDFHLLCRAEGFARKHNDDTLDEVLAAPDAPQLLAWMRARPLLHAANGHVMVHAGLLPQWSLARAQSLARGRGSIA